MSVRILITGLLLLLGGMLIGAWLAGGGDAPVNADHQQGSGPCDSGAEPLHWAAPMDPSYQRDGPGKSPMGMDLIPVCAGQPSEGVDVSISPQVVQNLGLRTAPVIRGVLMRDIHAVGSVGYDENSFRMIHARAEGWLEQLRVETEGAAVSKGEILYGLFSPKLVAAEREFLTALAAGRRLMIDAAAERLSALGYSAAQVSKLRQRGEPQPHLLRLADRDGVVAMLGVRQGQFISPGTHMMTLASLDKVWVLVDLMERDAGQLAAGLPVQARVDAYPGRQWQGRVDYVYPSLDPATRTVRARLVFDNTDGALRPNMFARASIRTEARRGTLSVPVSAVIRGGRGDRVVRQLDHGAFDVVPVRTGILAGDRLEILQGLDEGDRVVVAGQFLIDSEANLDAEALRMRAMTPTGTTRGVVRELDLDQARIVLEHGPVEPVGEAGLSMPAMTMPFELGPGLDASAIAPGLEVKATVRQVTAGRYQVSALELLPAPAAPAITSRKPTRPHAPDAGHQPKPSAKKPAAELTRGTVISINQAQGLLTLQHEDMPEIGMPAMTMPFPVAPNVELHELKAGDELMFILDPASLTINHLEKQQ